MIGRTLPGFLLVLLLAGSAAAQGKDLSELRRRIKSEELSLTVLLQSTVEGNPASGNGYRSGFRVPSARLALSGELFQRRFNYLLQGNFPASPGLLDLRLGYRPVPQLGLEIGQFKAPFSQEALIGAGSLEFTERSAVVSALAPGRQLGGEIRLGTSNGSVDLTVGAFNGNGQGRASNDDDRLLVAGRLAVHPFRSPRMKLDLAIQGGLSTDSMAPLGTLVSSFAGRRRLVGADIRMESNGWLVAAEGIHARLDFNSGPRKTPMGWYLTVGRTISGAVQLLTRWERLDTDGMGSDQNLILLGGQFRPNQAVRFRLHYGLPLTADPLGAHRIVGGAQLSL